MKAVFADTVYWVAVARPDDQWSEAAHKARTSLGAVRLVTTDEVLVEFLTALSSTERLRRVSAEMVRKIMASADVKVLPQTRDTFLSGVKLFEERSDKKYSLTDCISMNSMKKELISEILTIDNHFEQEGFEVLMKRSA
jgi:predicted nucleic acid-binding protein